MKSVYLALLITFLSSQVLLSSGFQLNDHSARSIGMGFSTVANIKDPSAVYFNPAAMVNSESILCISAGTAYIIPNAKFTGNTSLNQNITTETEPWNFIIPHFYAVWKTPVDGLSFGAGVFVPFGLGTRWDSDWTGRHSALETYLEAIEINPNIAYKFNLANMPISISAGFGYILGDVKLHKKLDIFQPEPLLKLEGDGNGTSFNFGLHIEPTKDIKIGLAYRHNIEIEFDGKVTYENIEGIQALFQEGTGKTKLNLPNDLKFGIAYQAIEDLWIELGINFVGWSSYDSLNIEFDKAPGNPQSSYISRQARLYEDVIAFRIAGEYKLSDCLSLRAGFYYDPLPVNADYIEPVLPEGNRYCGSLGIGYNIYDHLSVDMGYLGILAQQTEVKNNPNSFNGYYNTNANILSLSLNYKY